MTLSLYTPEFQYPKYDLYMESLIEIGRFIMENWYFAIISLHEIAYFNPPDVKFFYIPLSRPSENILQFSFSFP